MLELEKGNPEIRFREQLDYIEQLADTVDMLWGNLRLVRGEIELEEFPADGISEHVPTSA